MVFVHRTVVIYQHDAQRGSQLAVLEGVVQDYDIGLVLLYFREIIAAPYTVLVHRHGDGGELVRHLGRLVSVEGGRSVPGYDLEAFGAALVPAGKDGDIPVCPVVAFQQLPQDHLRMRGLARPADRDIAHADGGDGGMADLLEAFVVSEMAQGQDNPVQHYMESTLSTSISS